jgi:hypothetical protein
MNQGTKGYSLMKKTEGRKSRDTVPLMLQISWNVNLQQKKRQIYVSQLRNFKHYVIFCFHAGVENTFLIWF